MVVVGVMGEVYDTAADGGKVHQNPRIVGRVRSGRLRRGRPSALAVGRFGDLACDAAAQLAKIDTQDAFERGERPRESAGSAKGRPGHGAAVAAVDHRDAIIGDLRPPNFRAMASPRFATAILCGDPTVRTIPAAMFDLRNRVVLVTGASSGIGRACAIEFHRAGARVVALARTPDKLASLGQELGPERVHIATADITDAEQRARAVRSARERFGPVDVLVNNAGWASYGPVASLPREHAERMWSLNVAAPVAMIQAVLPEMVARRSGQIVNVSSVVAYQPMPRMGMYCATKAALTALSTSLRLELRGTGVGVIMVAPGSTNTGFFEAAAQIDTQAVRHSRLQQSPEHVARAIVRACRRGRREVVLSVEGRTILLIRRISHRLADWIVARVGDRTMPPTTHPSSDRT